MGVKVDQKEHIVSFKLVFEVVAGIGNDIVIYVLVIDAFLCLCVCNLLEKEVAFKLGALHQLLAETLDVDFSFTNKLKYFIDCFHHVLFSVCVSPRSLLRVVGVPLLVRLFDFHLDLFRGLR